MVWYNNYKDLLWLRCWKEYFMKRILVIDGNYERTLERRLQFCDTVFCFDFPTVACLFGVTKRVISNYGKPVMI